MNTETNKPNVKLQVLPSKRLKTNRLNLKSPKNYIVPDVSECVRVRECGLVSPIVSSPSLHLYLSLYSYVWQQALKQARTTYWNGLGVKERESYHIRSMRKGFSLFHLVACLPYPATSDQLRRISAGKYFSSIDIIKWRKTGIIYKHPKGGYTLHPLMFERIKLVHEAAITIYNDRLSIIMQNDDIL